MNQTIETILSRRSIRSYKGDAVDRTLIEKIIECGLAAPSAMNKQPWQITVVMDRAVLDDISGASRRAMVASGKLSEGEAYDHFHGAPAAIIVSGDADNAFSPADCANVMENMALAACSLGLGGLYVASFRMAFQTEDEQELMEKLRVPEGYQPLYALAVGYMDGPAPEAPARAGGKVSYIG